ncbi:TPA: hypothetical protein DIV55_02955 [Patescibacteria group bacterium]|nr:hypothetical protein [Patescibacteria group bacterium]
MYQKHYLLIPAPLQLLDQFDRWRKRAKLVNLSFNAQMRLEWLIFYFTAGKKNASKTAKYFGVSRSKFYFWFNRFNELNLKTLEDKSSIPKVTKKWQPDPLVLARMITLRKQYIHWGKVKLSHVYFNRYGEKISSWQFQRVIQKFKLYPARKIRKCAANGAKKQVISFNVRQQAKNLFALDTKVLHLFGKKYYIVFSVAHTGKLAYARAYTTHSSFAVKDFLGRLEYLLGARPEIILTDNGSEFQKHFEQACQAKKITRYYSRVQTPKDNPEVERMIKTYIEEWLCDGKWSPNLYWMNKYITDFIITYNTVRPHENLAYETPLAYSENHGLLSKRSSSCTIA